MKSSFHPNVAQLSRAQFESLLRPATAFLKLSRRPQTTAWLTGYAIGLRRAFHGENFIRELHPRMLDPTPTMERQLRLPADDN
jgi:hypothetical protein